MAEAYHVSRTTIYKIIRRGRQRDSSIHRSTNKRFCCLKYGIKRLSKIEEAIEARLKKQAKRYDKDYPGQMLHGDRNVCPYLRENRPSGEESIYLWALTISPVNCMQAILPDKIQPSSRAFLEQVLEECPYTIEQYYTENGKEYRGDPEHHAFMTLCKKPKTKVELKHFMRRIVIFPT